MEGIFLIVVCLLAGKILTFYVRSRQDFIASLNLVAIRIALPALILDKIHSQPFTMDAILPIAAPWILFLFVIALVYLINLIIPMSKTVIGCLILMVGTGNTSFVGFPLITALMGDQFLEYAIFYDQSNFILLFTVGAFVADLYTGKSLSLKENMKGLLRFTPIQALIIAFILKGFSIPYAPVVQHTLETFSALLTPLTMISVGASLRLPSQWGLLKPLAIGLVAKLMILPAIALALLTGIYQSSIHEVNLIIVLQTGMAPMVLATIIAMEKNLEPELSNLLTAIGIPISFLTVAGWYLLLA